MADEKKVELVAHRDQPHRTTQIGFGLLSSVVVGFSPLTDALQGNGSFENAIGRYLACVAFCVAAALVIGRLLDAAPAAEARNRRVGQTDDPDSDSTDKD